MNAEAPGRAPPLRRVVSEATIDDKGLARALRPRRSVVLEEEAGDGTFVATGGPLADYRRTVEDEPMG